MGHKMGIHWMRHHPDDDFDMTHMRHMQYKSFTLFEEGWSNAGFCRLLLENAGPDTIFLLRDHPLSEEKPGAISDPAGFGTSHGLSWAKKWKDGKIHLPPERVYHLGINELDTNQYQAQNDLYTTHFAQALASNGLLAGGWSFGVGHPSTLNLDPKQKPDWSHYRKSAETLRRLKGIAVIHEYWMPNNYNWGNWAGRYAQHCPYDVPYVVTESLYDSGVANKFPNRGYKDYVDLGNPAEINIMLAEYNGYMSRLSADPRFHSCQMFTYDFAHPWDSFDIRSVARHIEAYPWTVAAEQEQVRMPVVVKDKPGTTSPASGVLAYPFARGILTQRFGENPQNYAGFGLPGHNGVDYGLNLGDAVLAIADGTVEWAGDDKDYGNYVRIFHADLGFHSFYAHLDQIDVRKGEPVRQGRVIGTAGDTGNSTGPHLHFEIRLAHPDGSYREGTFGYGKGRVDPETVYAVLNRGQNER